MKKICLRCKKEVDMLYSVITKQEPRFGHALCKECANKELEAQGAEKIV